MARSLGLVASAAAVLAALTAGSMGVGVGATPYSASEGTQFVYLSAAAYCTAGPVSNWTCAACTQGPTQLSNVHFLSNVPLSNYGYVGTDSGGSVYVSFRGTTDFENWVHNLDAIFMSFSGCSNCKVHKGFYQCYAGLSQQLQSALAASNAQSAPAVYTTGHSLGGAMTNLATFELALAGYPVAMMMNFGQPRVGDAAYASAFLSTIVAGSDTGSQTDDSTNTKTGGGSTTKTTGGTGGHGSGTTGSTGTTTGGGGGTTTNTQPTTTTGGGGGTTSNTHPTTTGGTGTGTGTGGGSTTGKSTTKTSTGGTTGNTSGGSTTGGSTTGGSGTTTTGGSGNTSSSGSSSGGSSSSPTTGSGTSTGTTTGSSTSSHSGSGGSTTSAGAPVRGAPAAAAVRRLQAASGATAAAAMAAVEEERVASVRLNEDALRNTNATEVLMSAIMAHAISLALDRPMNAHLRLTPRDKAAIRTVLTQHAGISVAHARGEPLHSVLRAPFAEAHVQALTHLRFPAPRFAAPAAESGVALRGASPAGWAAQGFSAARSYRVVHNADVVPHVPPESFGYRHTVEEVWYTEDASSYTACSVKNGEDPKCSDSLTLPDSISDHLTYLNLPISNLC